MKILYLPSNLSQQRQFEKKNVNIYPILLAMEAEWHRRNGDEVVWASRINYHRLFEFDKIITEPEGLPFLSLPHPDRVFTRAKDYTSGNYKYLPGTHMQVANGCWWGKCSFCVENCAVSGASAVPLGETKSSTYQVRPVEDVISEIEEIAALGFKEVFDDSGTFPNGNWLDEFLGRIRTSNVSLRYGCNTRIADYPWVYMRRAGFRMVLFGVESGNQETLDKINKGVKVEDIIATIKKASEAGLSPHIAVMFGYPWETDADAIRTLRLVHYLLRKGFAKTAQASFYTPKAEAILDVSNLHHRKYVKKIYEVAYSPEFWFNKIREIRDTSDLQYLWRQIKVGLNESFIHISP